MSEEKKIVLTKKDVNKVIARWYVSNEMALNFERMQSIAFTYSLVPALKKLYPNKEDMIPVLQRHMELFNTNATAGGLILGTTLAMEEEIANNPESMPGEAVIAVKTGLMGPVAALGDSFSAGTLTTLFILAACSVAQEGSMMGLFILFLGSMVTLVELILTTNLTYTKGRSAIKGIMSSKLMKDVIEGANILGMAMMGVLSASMVNLSIAFTANFGESVFSVQEKIDGIMPGILPLSVLFIYYYLISKKGVSIAKLVLATLVLGIATAFIGLF